MAIQLSPQVEGRDKILLSLLIGRITLKKFRGNLFAFFFALLFSGAAFADLQIVLQGPGTAASAVKAFNKAVVVNDGTIDKNASTEYSSVGIFENEEYSARMSAEEEAKNHVRIKVSVSLRQADLISFLTVQKKVEMDIITKIYNSLKKAGYDD